MFESHFGLRENPFTSGHQSRFVYPSHEHQEALAHLRYGIENLEPFVLITGEVGTGKTTALFEAFAELQTRVSVALITNSALTRDELVDLIGKARADLLEPAGLYDDHGEVVPEVLAKHIADVFLIIHRLIDAMRKSGKARKEETDGCIQ